MPTEASLNFELNSQIVPVSIYYRDVFEFLTDVYITFGTPIEVSQYKEVYEENPNLATNQLRQDLETSLKSLVVNIWNDEFYEEYKDAIDWNGDRLALEKYSHRKDDYLQASLEIVRSLDNLYENKREEFDNKIKDFREAKAILKEHQLNTKDKVWKPASKGNIYSRFAGLILTAPIMLFGYLNAIFPLLINKKLLGLFKDNQFIPSVRYVSGLIFIPIFDLIQSLIIGSATNNWLLALIYFFAMPITFYFALYWRKWWHSANRDLKVSRFKKQFSDKWERLVQLIKL